MVLNAFKHDLSRDELSHIQQDAKKDKPCQHLRFGFVGRKD